MSEFQIISIAANTIDIFFRLLSFLIIARIFLSWVAPHSHGRIAEFIISTTQPVLRLFAKLPLRIGMMDFTPLVALILLDLLRGFLLQLLFGIQ
jgi:YggT family protein